jgi:hypothetical protein
LTRKRKGAPLAASLAILALASATMLAACQKKDAMLSAEQVKGIKVKVENPKASDKAVAGLDKLGQSLDASQGYVMPLPSSYATVAQGYNFKFVPLKSVRTGTDFAGLERKALNLGIRGADAVAILYVDPKDSRLPELGKDMLELAKALGVSKALADELGAMGDDLKSGDAEKVRTTIDAMTRRVDLELTKGNMRELAVLSSLGAWTEVLQNIALSLEKEMNVEVASSVLPMVEIPETYASSLAKLFPGKIAGDPLVSLLYKDVGKVGEAFKKMAGSKDAAVLKQGVAELKKLSAEMVTAAAGGAK